MLKQIKTLIIVTAFIISFSENVYADEISEIIDISNLIENAAELDQQEVTVSGEAVGEAMNRGKHSWININDGTNAIGIWMSSSDAQRVKYFGNYKYKGDVLKVSGIFNRTCKEHGGESDIHGASMEVEKTGHVENELISATKITVAALSAVLAASLMTLFLLETRHSK
ncbi:DNA-binding protein [Sedimentibacter saalensis]|uniref:DNA-binding protein n=1 Tax=Sedimentibacter saalensis TaxID=130788 RepID=UPI002899C61C|nr:DNA-binding protein [Sedimentibacter saalensis]